MIGPIFGSPCGEPILAVSRKDSIDSAQKAFQRDVCGRREGVPMGRIFIPTTSAEDWKRLLAEPEKHWRTGFSAKALAYCWEDADGFPPEIARLFAESEFPSFQGIEPLLAFPEYQVSLPGGARPSQNDVFVLAKAREQLIAITVEGKVSESFGPTLEEWGPSESPGKTERLAFLKEVLGLTSEIPPYIRYQLLHRTASAVLEAHRFSAPTAAMIVHSFRRASEPGEDGFDDYQSFLRLFGVSATRNQLVFLRETQGVNLYCGWATGDPRYLEACDQCSKSGSSFLGDKGCGR